MGGGEGGSETSELFLFFRRGGGRKEGRKEQELVVVVVGNYSFVCLFVCFLPDRMIVINNVTVWREGGRVGKPGLVSFFHFFPPLFRGLSNWT